MDSPSLPPLVEPADELGDAEAVRYSRTALVPEIGALGQRRLKNARVLVVGAGGLGCPALLTLAAMGVGTLGVVDDDVVDASNLQRQIAHGTSDVGRPKVDSVRDSVRELNPYVAVEAHRTLLDAANVLDLFRGYDVVLDATDNFATRYLISDAAALTGRPCVWGSVLRLDGQASVFWEGHGPTYRDLYPEEPPGGAVPSCAEGGVLGTLCATIGSIMATEAVKLVTGTGRSLLGRLLSVDALGASWREIPVRRDPRRAPVDRLPDGPPPEVSARRLGELLEARSRGETDFVLVDVREPEERAVVRIPGSVSVPLAEFRSGTAVAGLPRDRPVILYCRSGVRSAEALGVLRRAGFARAEHLAGGVLAWAEQLDRARPGH